MINGLDRVDFDINSRESISTIKKAYAAKIVIDIVTVLIKLEETGKKGSGVKKNEKLSQLSDIFEKRLKFTKPLDGESSFVFHLEQNSFLIMACIYGTFIYLMGRYPNTYFLTYCQVLMPTLLVLRYIEFHPRKWHLMLIDFCYIQDTLTLYFITFG